MNFDLFITNTIKFDGIFEFDLILVKYFTTSYNIVKWLK